MSAPSTGRAERKPKVEPAKEALKLRRSLTTLTEQVMRVLIELEQFGASERGVPRAASERLGRIANSLEMANDTARFFGLGIDHRTDTARKAKFKAAYKPVLSDPQPGDRT